MLVSMLKLLQIILPLFSTLFITGQALSSLRWIKLANINIFHFMLVPFCLAIICIQICNFKYFLRFYLYAKRFILPLIFFQLILLLLVLFNQMIWRDFLRQFLHVVVSFCFAFLVFLSNNRVRQVLSLAALFTSFSFCSVFAIYFLNSPNLLHILWEGIVSTDPSSIIFGVFKASITSDSVLGASDEEIRASIRHGISSAILASSFISLTFFRSLSSQIQRRLVSFALILCSLLLVLLMSRAVLVAALLSIIQFILLKKKIRLASIKLVPISILIFALSLIFGRLLISRFLDNQSYNARLENLFQSINLIVSSSFIFPASHEESLNIGNSHIWSIELWKIGGLVGLSAGLIINFVLLACIFSVGSLWFKKYNTELFALGFDPRFAALSIWLPLVRLQTANSPLGLNEWISIGLFTGVYSLISYSQNASNLSSLHATYTPRIVKELNS